MQLIITPPHSEVLVQAHPSATAAVQAGVAQIDPLHACPEGHTVHVSVLEQEPPDAAVTLPACLQTPPQHVPMSQLAVVLQAKVLQ